MTTENTAHPGRKPIATPEIIDAEAMLDQPRFANAMAVMRADGQAHARAESQHQAHVRAVAAQVGYQLPGDCADPDLIQRDVAANMRRSVEACLEVGRGLTVLKAVCQHGEFAARLDVLNIDKHVASRFMQAAVKFSKLPTSATLKAIGNQSKLFEMLVLDDEQIEELELTGQTGDLKLDEVASMSVKELRAALRELKGEVAAKEEVLARRARQVDALEEKLARVQKMPPDEAALELQAAVTRMMNGALGAIRGQFAYCLRALDAHDQEHGPGNNLAFMAGAVGTVQAELNAIRDALCIPDVLPALIPEWVTDPEFNKPAAK